MSSNVSSLAVVEPGVIIGDNCYIGDFVKIRKGVVIGDNVEVRDHCFIAPSATIGNNVRIYQLGSVCFGAKIGDNTYIGPMVMMTNTRRIKHIRKYKLVITPPTIGKNVRIASRVTLGPGVTIGDNALVGMGSVVTRDVPAGEVWYGNPAKFVRMVDPEELVS